MTTPVSRSPAIAPDPRWLARAEGLVAALRASVPAGVLPVGPRGHALVPADVARDAVRVHRRDGRVAPREPAAEAEPVEHPVPGGLLVAVRGARSGVPPGWETDLLAVHLGVVERVRDACVEYLRTRVVGDRALTEHSLVQADVADVQTELWRLEAALAAGAGRAAELHGRLTRAGRAVLRLHGAAGALRSGPGAEADAAELVVGCYVSPAP